MNLFGNPFFGKGLSCNIEETDGSGSGDGSGFGDET